MTVTRDLVTGLLRKAEELITECSADYNHPYFTDRRQAGPRLKSWLDAFEEALPVIQDFLHPKQPDQAPVPQGGEEKVGTEGTNLLRVGGNDLFEVMLAQGIRKGREKAREELLPNDIPATAMARLSVSIAREVMFVLETKALWEGVEFNRERFWKLLGWGGAEGMCGLCEMGVMHSHDEPEGRQG